MISRGDSTRSYLMWPWFCSRIHSSPFLFVCYLLHRWLLFPALQLPKFIPDSGFLCCWKCFSLYWSHSIITSSERSFPRTVHRALLSCLVTSVLISPFHKTHQSWNLLWVKCAVSPTTSYLHIWSPSGSAVLGGCRTSEGRNMAVKVASWRWASEGHSPACL